MENKAEGNAALLRFSRLIPFFADTELFLSLCFYWSANALVTDFSTLRGEDQLPFQSEHLLSAEEQESAERLFDYY